MVMAQSLFISLKKSNPNGLIDVLAPAWSLPLLDMMPEVSKAIVMPLQHGQFGLMSRIKLGRQLRTNHYDQAIILPNSWKSAIVPFFARIPHRTGYRGEWRWGLLNDVRKLDKSILTMTVQRFVTLGLPKNAKQPPDCQHPSLPANKTGQDAVIQKFSLMLSESILALCPGAESAAGINKLTNQQCRDFVGQTSLLEAVELMSLANTVVANDSGLMHLAAALDKNVIAIYGSTPPDFAPPLCKNAQTVSLHLPCSPCRKRVCPLFPVGHPGHTQCLTGIKPERILELIGD